MPSDPPTPVATLARVSTAAQASDDRHGLARQRAAIDEAVRRYDLQVVHAVELRGVPGHRVGSTPEWAEVRAMLASGAVRGVVADSVDRLCRASEMDLSVLADIQRADAMLYTPGEARPIGMMDAIKAIFGGHEKDEIARRSMGSKIRARKKKRWTQGAEHLPFGVAYDKKSQVWGYTDDSKKILEMAQRYAEGRSSLVAIAAAVGVSYNIARVSLSHPMYRGVMSDLAGGWVTIFDPPLIGAKLAARIDARRARRARVYSGDHRRRLRGMEDDPYLLRDVLACARCGGRMDAVVNRRRKKGRLYEYRWYRCASAHRASEPDRKPGHPPCSAGPLPIEAVHWAVSAHLEWVCHDIGAHNSAIDLMVGRDPDEVQAAFEAGEPLPEAEGPDGERLESLRAAVKRLNRERMKHLRNHARGHMSDEEIDRLVGEIRRETAAAEAELAGLEAEAAAREYVEGTLRALADRVYAEVAAGRGETLPRLLREAGGRVRIDRVDPGPRDAADTWLDPDRPDAGIVWTVKLRRTRYGVAITSASVDAAAVLARGLTEQQERGPEPPDGGSNPPSSPVTPASRVRTKNVASSTKWPRT